MSRPDSCAASRIAWRQPPHGVQTRSPPGLRRSVAAGNRDPRHLVQAEGVLGGGQRALLGAQAEAVAGVLHIGAGDHLAVDAFDRAADREIGNRAHRPSARPRARRRSAVLRSCNCPYARPMSLAAMIAVLRTDSMKFVRQLSIPCRLRPARRAAPSRRRPRSPVAQAPIEVQILAINDFHGNLETPTSGRGHRARTAASASSSAGGAAIWPERCAGAATGHPYRITVSAGDLIGASPLISAYFLDEPTIDAMNLLGLELQFGRQS